MKIYIYHNLVFDIVGCEMVCSPCTSWLHCPNVQLKEKLESLWPCDAAAEDGRLLQLCDLACGHDVAMLQWSGHTGPGLHRSACRNGTSWPIGALQCSDQSTLTVNRSQHCGPTVSQILSSENPAPGGLLPGGDVTAKLCLLPQHLQSHQSIHNHWRGGGYMIVFWCFWNKDFQTNKLLWLFVMSSLQD